VTPRSTWTRPGTTAATPEQLKKFRAAIAKVLGVQV
jgi:hypothetical protein